MFEKLAHLMYRRRRLVLGAWALVLLVAAGLASQVGSVLGPGDPVSKGSDSDKAAVLLDSQFHQNDQRVSLIVLHNPEATIGSPAFRSAVAATTARIRADRALRVSYLDNPLATGNQQLVSRDRHSVVLRVSSALAQADVEKQIDHLRQIVRTPGFTTYVTGSPAQSHDNVAQGRADLARGDSITAPILILILLLVFGSLVAASLPLVLALSSIILSLAVVYIFAHFLDTSVVVTNLVTILGLGIGIDYSLFIVYRYRQELRASDGDPETAVIRTMRTTGRAVFFSGLTVAIGISTLILTGVPFMQSLGLGGLLVPLSALAITMTLLPALLGVLGTRINRLRVVPGRFLRTGDAGVWRGMASVIMRRPLLAGGAVLLLLLALTYPVTQLGVAYGSLKNQPRSEESVVGLAFVQANFSSAPSPIQVVIEARHGSLLQPARLAELRTFEAEIRRDPDVAQVVGPADVPRTLRVPSSTFTAAQIGSIQGRYLSSDHSTALISVVGRPTLGTHEGDALVRRIRDDATTASAGELRGDVVHVGGQQAEFTDFNHALYAKFPLIVGIVLVLTYGFLFLAFRSIFLPLKAVLLNLLSVGASYGILQLVFQRGVGAGLLRFTPENGVVSFVPILLFALLFGLSTDYEVFLLSRIRERWFTTGDNRDSVGYGLQQTGRLISSAALIMIVAFSGFLIGDQIQLKEFGFGLMAAIAIDATLIRLVLVPSLMAVVGGWNWWVPGFLRDFAGRGATFDEHDLPAELGDELATA